MHASQAGSVALGGDRTIHRVGFGTMRLTGPGIYGPPSDVEAARTVLRALPDLGVNLIDTSNAYGPVVAEWLIREALHPYRGLTIATSGGLLRPGPFQWTNEGRPSSLRIAVETSLKVLGVECIELWRLNQIDPAIPADEQFAAIADMQRAGLIRHIGLCHVTVDEIAAAEKHFRVASVQRRYHVIDRGADPVLEYCERRGIPFFAFFPQATGALAAPDSILSRVAATIGITPGQAALAWLLRRSTSLVVLPGTSRLDHLRENVAAAGVTLTDDQYAEIGRLGARAALLRAPAPAAA